VIDAGTRALLLEIPGLITPAEGEKLAELAGLIRAEQAIVEIGSHRGLSACWLASGARSGAGARVTCVDPWPQYEPPGLAASELDSEPWGEVGALERFMANVGEQDCWPYVTPLRATAAQVAQMWVKPVGLWFHDADHRYDAVRDDFLAWERFVSPGGWFAVHDYYGSVWKGAEWVRDGSEQKAVADHYLPSGEWEGVEIVDNLWVGRRM